MSLAILHANLRGTGGKYDDAIDAINANVPYAQAAGQKWLDFHASNPKAEMFVSVFGTSDLVFNAGDATLGGVAGLLDDDALRFFEEAGDTVGNPIMLAGGGTEAAAEYFGLENAAGAGDFVEGIGHFLSSGSERPEYWESHLEGHQAAEGYEDGGAGNSGGSAGGNGDVGGGEANGGDKPTDLDYSSDSAPFDSHSESQFESDLGAITGGEPMTKDTFLDTYGGVQETSEGDYKMVVDGYELDLGHLNETERAYLKDLSAEQAYDLFEETDSVK